MLAKTGVSFELRVMMTVQRLRAANGSVHSSAVAAAVLGQQCIAMLAARQPAGRLQPAAQTEHASKCFASIS